MITSTVKRMETKIGLEPGNAIALIRVGKKYSFKDVPKDGHALSKEFWALNDLSLECPQGQVLGIIGRNGSGKTTLLSVICGVLTPTRGEVSIKGRVLGLFNLGVGFQDELTAQENIFLNGTLLGSSKKEIKRKLKAIIDFSELGNFINMPLGTYSQGMRLRLGFSIVSNLDFDVLAIDEVLAVGDSLFQSKCFQRLMEFKRNGKTLIITTQNMDLIERLSDKAALLEHGKLLFLGNPAEAIQRYRALLNNDKFFVGPKEDNAGLISKTKRWADSKTNWGNELGTKEVIIESVKFKNRFGLGVRRLKSGDSLKIKVFLRVRNNIKEPHFGMAIFREDGVYCYGPNTSFDGYYLPVLKPGRSWFSVEFKRLALAPGRYRISVGVWDKNEALPFGYQEGYHRLVVTGNNLDNRLLDLAVIPDKGHILGVGRLSIPQDDVENQSVKIDSIKLLDASGRQRDIFFTNDPVELSVNFKNLKVMGNNCFLWIALYRDDDVYCQGFGIPVKSLISFGLKFPKLALLPGGYKFAIGIWDDFSKSFLSYNKCAYRFNMVFNRRDHGTVYLEHDWKWRTSLK